MMENFLYIDNMLTVRNLLNLSFHGFLIAGSISFFFGKDWMRAVTLTYMILMFELLIFAYSGM